ncbi:hypothetical protein L6164_032934 [Bauhinia variegata]|uniref:Uncharacterized protein n=1 Tax=Bauhinia variegata TaxID=167791 RepID=A0ACB9KQD6_BAUVA|nr:hypothetical protein L6164_032934 [Bauhinia variegata]
MEKRVGRRLVLFPLPVQGHINPMLELAHLLYSKGFSITIIQSDFNSLNPSKYPNFTFHSLFYGFSLADLKVEDFPSLAILFNNRIKNPFKECLAKLVRDASESEEPIACLISDALYYFTQSVANSLQLPRIALRTGGSSSTLAYVAFPSLKEKGYLPTPGSQFDVEEAVAEVPPLRVKDLPLINTKHPDKFYEVICNLVNETMVSSGVIFNTFEELESLALAKLRQQFSIPIFSIGPFHKYFPSGSGSSNSLVTPDETCIPWLDKQEPKSVVYVSFGSLAALAEIEMLEIAWGLANSNHPFLWVVRPGMIGGSEWLEGLPSGFVENLGGRGHIVKWAPQPQVLAHPAVGAFWTHCGWNSTVESICEGVPMICMPRFTDQLVNARYVSHVWKIGLQLEKGSERGEIERTIRKLLEENEGKEIRERSSSLKEKAKLCLKQGGSSYHSLEALVAHILSLESIYV